MKPISEVTACVIDHGLGLPVAMELSKKCKRVLYWSPFEKGFSTIKEGCLGDGFGEIERCQDIWLAKNDVDLFVFPDIQHAGMQLELESQGKAVWGSRRADSIELNREKFLNILGEVGLDVPEYEVKVGLTDLRKFLYDKEDQYIKISRWRGDMETTHWRNWRMDEGFLDHLAVKFGPVVKEHVRFLVFPNIDTDLEIGGDTYCVDGQWPSKMIHGIEWKDKAYFGAVTERREMPDQIKNVLEAFAPVLAEYRYRNEWSMELRVKGRESFFIDPTCRIGLPSTSSQMTLWKNFAEIIWHGANGELLEPEETAEFSAECVLTVKSEKGNWAVAELPEELKPWAKLASCCYSDGVYAFPPDGTMGDEVGWLVATADSPKATLERMKELAGMLPDGLSANVESLANIIQEIGSMEEEGIEFTSKPMPEPAEVLEEK